MSAPPRPIAARPGPPRALNSFSWQENSRRSMAATGKTTASSSDSNGPQLARARDMEAIYERPQDYDLEHEGDDEDVAFYQQLLDRWRPGRVLELASGSGRVTIPLACAAEQVGAEIVG